MRENRGYWIYNYLPTPINLTLKNVLPVNFSVQKSFPIRSLMFKNTTDGTMKNVTEAVEPPVGYDWAANGNVYRGWFGSVSLRTSPPFIPEYSTPIYYWDADNGGFEIVLYTQFLTQNLSSWEGYFLRMNYPEISVIVQE